MSRETGPGISPEEGDIETPDVEGVDHEEDEGDDAPDVAPRRIRTREERERDQAAAKERARLSSEAARERARDAVLDTPEATASAMSLAPGEQREEEIHWTLSTPEGDVPLQKALGLPEVRILIGPCARGGNTLFVPRVPRTKEERLSLVVDLLKLRSANRKGSERTKDEGKIATQEEAKGRLDQAWVNARTDKDMSERKRIDTILATENNYAETLKDGRDAMEALLKRVSQELENSTGHNLETLLQLSEADRKALLDAWLCSEGRNLVAGWDVELSGYKNNATGDTEHPNPFSREGWKRNAEMFWASRDFGRQAKIMHRLGYTPGRVMRFAGTMTKKAAEGGILLGALTGLLGRVAWRGALEVPAYYAFTGFKKLVGGALEELGVPNGWLMNRWEKSPWEQRDEPMLSPWVRVFKAGKYGQNYGDLSVGKEKK